MSEPVILVEKLVKRYGATLAVDGIGFAVARGVTAALLGGNGAGKTTTLAILLGLLLPTAGAVHVLRRGHAAPSLPGVAADEFLLALCRPAASPDGAPEPGGLRPALRPAAACASGSRCWPAICRSSRLLDRPAGKLSSGQKTRVALAKALLNEPELLLLDEPTASLDPDTGDWVRGYLEDYRDRTGATILLASHNMGEVERLCSEVMMMKTGQIVDRGSPGRADRALRPHQPRGGVPAHRARAAAGAGAGAMTSPALRRFGEAPFSPARVWAMLLRYLYILRSSWPRTIELLYWPTLQMLIWGFMSQFLRGNSSYVARAFGVLLAAVMLWDLMFRSQLGLSISFLEEMWSRNLGQLFVTPLRPYEWVLSLLAMSVIRVTIGIVPAALLAIPLYHYSIFDMGWPLVAFLGVLMAMGWALGLAICGGILRHGMGAESLAWTVIFALAPLELRLLPGHRSCRPGCSPVAWALPLDACLRGHARGAVPARLPHGLFPRRRRSRPRLPGDRRRHLLHRLPRRPPPRRADADGGVGTARRWHALRA